MLGTKTKRSCNHCGQCCLAISCQISQILFYIGENDRCPAIEEQEGLYYCGLIQNTSKYVTELVGGEEWKAKFLKSEFSKMLGISYGCDSDK